MDYAETHTITAESSYGSLNIYPCKTATDRRTLSGKIAQKRQSERVAESFEPFKGVVVAVIFSLPFWLGLAYMLAF